MKKLFLTGIGLLFAATLTFGQEVEPEVKAKAKVEKLTEKLSLTGDQQGPIYEIVLSTIASKKALKSDATSTDEAKKAQLDAIKSESQEKIKALLTPEQKEAYDKHLAEKEEK